MGKKQKLIINRSDYKLTERIGGGSAGEVWKAQLVRNIPPIAKKGDFVAVKLYRKEILEEPQERKRIAEEYRTGSQLVHPNLVKMYYVDIEDPDPYLVMELYDGYNLKDWREKYPKPDLEFLLEFTTQILDALDFIHSSRRCHRDVKPTNIHIDSKGIIRLMDYGVIRSLRDPSITEKGGSFLGTYRYAPPEIIKNKTYSYSSDLYAFGGTLYYLLTGKEIFDLAKSKDEVKNAKPFRDCQLDRELKNKGPIWEALANLCEKLLSIYPSARPPSAMACLDLLGRELPDLVPLRVYFAASLTKLSNRAKRHREKVASVVKQAAERNNFKLYQPKDYTHPEGAPDLGSTEVYWIDRERVASSDLLFAYANAPSFGVGQEVEIAANAGVPIVILYTEGTDVSRMLRGTFGRIIGMLKCKNDSDIASKSEKFFEKNDAQLRLSRRIREPEFHLKLGDRIRDIRESRSMTIDELSERAEVDKELIFSLETRPEKLSCVSIINLRRLAKALDVTPAEFLKEQPGELELKEELWRESVFSLRSLAHEKQLSYAMYEKLEDMGKKAFWSPIKELSARPSFSVFKEDEWRKLLHELLDKEHED